MPEPQLTLGVPYEILVLADGRVRATQRALGAVAPWEDPRDRPFVPFTFELPSLAPQAPARAVLEMQNGREYVPESGPLFANAGPPNAAVARLSPASPDLVWLDTESSGAGPEDQVIEVACMRTNFDGAHPRAHFQSLVQLHEGTRAPNFYALRVSGLDPKSAAFVARARPLACVLEQLDERLRGATLAGHNVGSDARMLRHGYARLERAVPPALREGAAVVDTLTMATALRRRSLLAVPSLKLGSLAEALGVDVGNAHRAASDVRTNHGVFLALRALEAKAA